MALQGSPKKLAEDISNGFFYVTIPYLKTLSGHEIKELYNALKIVQRDIRAMITTETEDTKKKQMRLMRLNNVLTVIENYARKYRILI
ncbi:MAG: hypothetical protein N2999_03015 [Proteobacteria bacterium]|nr:hypothetical protein [Pseudomonadota bacterium]